MPSLFACLRAPLRLPDVEEERGAEPGLAFAVMLLAGGISLLVVFSLGGFGESDQYLVVAPFGYGAADTLAIVLGADGLIVSAGGFPNVIIAASERPGFAEDLRRAGAWLALPAPALAGCGGEGGGI